jgi:hypothetical protein
VFSLGKLFTPVISAPKANATTYSRNPRILIQTVAPPGAKPQTVFGAGYYKGHGKNPLIMRFSVAGGIYNNPKT